MSTFHFTNSSIKSNSFDWHISEPIDLNTNDISTLSKTYSVRYDRDYHGCGIYRQCSLFEYLYYLDEYNTLLHRFSIDELISFRDANNNNVLHATVKNRNEECTKHLISLLPNDILCTLANQLNIHNRKPITYAYNSTRFNLLLPYTYIDVNTLQEIFNNSSFDVKNLICYLFNSALDDDFINNLFNDTLDSMNE